MRSAGLRVFLLVWAFLLPGPVAQADDAWAQRVERLITQLEKALEKEDGEEAVKGTLSERVSAIDRRIVTLEKSLGIKPGKEDLYAGPDRSRLLSSLTQSVVSLQARLKHVQEEKHGAPEERPPRPPPPPKPEQPTLEEQSREVEWPKRLTFNATAVVNYVDVGEWLYGSPRRRTRERDDFLMTGYEGQLSFTIRTVGLKREIKSADIIVIVYPSAPFRSDNPVVYEVEWRAQRHMWNSAKKTWTNYDTWTQSVTPHWTYGPERKATRPRVEARVRSVVTKDGEEILFSLTN